MLKKLLKNGLRQPGNLAGKFRIQRAGCYSPKAFHVDPTQAYFWTAEWQKGEAEAERDIRKGRVKKFGSVKGLMRDLES